MLRLTVLVSLLLLTLLAGPAAAAELGGFSPVALTGLVFFNLVAGAILLLLVSGLAVALADRLKRLAHPAGRKRLVLPAVAERRMPLRVPATIDRTAAVRRQGLGG